MTFQYVCDHCRKTLDEKKAYLFRTPDEISTRHLCSPRCLRGYLYSEGLIDHPGTIKGEEE